MIPNTDYGQTISSNNMVTGRATIEMTPAMFNILSNQVYSDKILAVIRESLCNAKDAQLEVNAGKPIEVHLPNLLEPFLHIRDYGPGLSERQVCGYYESSVRFNSETGEKETIQEFIPGLYLRYGLSTKTKTNLSIGGLGLGCKSPLAYSDSFIVESYQKGVCKTYTIYKENGKPQVSKLTEIITTEPNGLKVKLAVKDKDHGEFSVKIANFLKFFDHPVNICGNRSYVSFDKPVPVLESDLYSIFEPGWHDSGQVGVLMGGVVYGLTARYKERLAQIVRKDFMLLKFEIGELTVAASREGLSEDPQTVQIIEERIKKITKSFYKDLVNQIDKCHTESEAFEILKKYNLIYKSGSSGYIYEPVESATTLVIRNGRLIKDFLSQYQSEHRVLTYRSLNKPPTITDITNISNENLTLLETDKKTGYLKVARKLAEGGKTVILIQGADEKTELESFFGELDTKKTSVEYPVMFPKRERGTSIRVASSGLRTHEGVDVKTLEEEQEGYYIPYTRDKCNLIGLSNIGLRGENGQGITELILNLVDGGVFTKDEVFFSRKAGLPVIRKTRLKELTADIIVDKIKEKVTKEDSKSLIQYKGEPGSTPFSKKFKLKRLWEEIKVSYPLHANIGKVDMSSKVRKMLICLPSDLLALIIPDYKTSVEEISTSFKQEAELILKENKLALLIPIWNTNEDLVDELINFSKFKKKLT